MAQINKVNVSDTTYDISQSPDATFTATSNDNASPTSWTDVAVLASGETNSSIFSKISSMFKNIRFLYSKLGTSDFSSAGDTVSAALAALESGKSNTDHTHTAATTAAAGFMPALNGNSDTCLLGDGTWGTAGSTYANVSTAAPGLAPTLSGTATQYLNGAGNWTTPPDTNTTYSAGVGLGLSGTQFYCKTPRIEQNANTQLSVNTYDIKEFSNNSANLPTAAWYYIINMKGSDNNYQAQLALGETVDAAYYRSYKNGTWGSWRSIINTDSNTTYAFSNNNPTLSWGATSTVGTVGGVALTVKMPANPNTNTTYGTNVGCYGTLSGTTLVLNTRNFRV